ncbi:uncharacterized protein PSANT_06975 [Moesziomyces antarcticus]|uniref:DDE-1 domain-containing protein n=1 Tax=Pseudozyma antarctica TaxID=84753 RepID=A0A5C3FY62_PSEA2|nr:uncharacterized protein PSANT_06975 [Moesziomyces antarcticus]
MAGQIRISAWIGYNAVLSHIQDKKRLLLLDGHNSHTSLAFTEFAERNNIILLCFPAHATHLLQPLDVAIFGSLKAQYTKMISSLAKSELAINKVQFLRIYIKIRDRIITPRVARSAFKSVGIDTIVNALPVLSRLPEDRKNTPEQQNHDLPQTPRNSHQLVSIASKIRSLERPNRTSRQLWTKLIKAAGHFHSENVLLHQEIKEVRQTLAYKSVRTPMDQSKLSQAKILDSREIQDAISCRKQPKMAQKRQSQRQQSAQPLSEVSHDDSVAGSQDTSSGSSPILGSSPEPGTDDDDAFTSSDSSESGF